MISIKELRFFLNELPSEFDDCKLVNGEFIDLDGELHARIDKPIMVMSIDENSREMCFLHQSQDEIDDIVTND